MEERMWRRLGDLGASLIVVPCPTIVCLPRSSNKSLRYYAVVWTEAVMMKPEVLELASFTFKAAGSRALYEYVHKFYMLGVRGADVRAPPKSG